MRLTVGSPTSVLLRCQVSPILATIMHHFGRKDSWMLTDLAKAMHMKPACLHPHCLFWLHKGLLLESHVASGEKVCINVKGLG